TSNVRILPFSSAATLVGPDVVISSSPSEPCTTQMFSEPRFCNTCTIGSSHCFEQVPIICRLTPARLDSGPSRLKLVRVPRSMRVGPTVFIAGWWAGADIKPIPASRMHKATCFASRSILTPSACRASAAPDLDDSARFPCLATGTPAPATIKAAQVEMLNEPEASPPVPTTSTAPAGAVTPSILARIVVTAPVISSTVSPRTRSAISSPPICDGVASPDIMRSKAPAASSRVRLAPVATLAMSALKSSAIVNVSGCRLQRRCFARRHWAPTSLFIPGGGDVEKIPEHQIPVLRGDAFRVELHTMHRKAGMDQPHDQAVVRLGIHRKFVRHARALNHERMIARCLQRSVNAAKHAGTLVADLGDLSMLRGCAHHLAAKSLPDGLVAKAYAQDWYGRRGLLDKVETYTGFIGGSWPRRKHDNIGLQGHHAGHRNLVVSMHDNISPEPSQIVDEVKGEAVVIIDQDDHVPPLCQGFKVAPEGGQAARWGAGY